MALPYETFGPRMQLEPINESTNSIKVKISRGAFEFAFFLQCAAAIGIKNLRLDELIDG